jgi:hypothetical protein
MRQIMFCFRFVITLLFSKRDFFDVWWLCFVDENESDSLQFVNPCWVRRVWWNQERAHSYKATDGAEEVEEWEEGRGIKPSDSFLSF